jgi:hypothetical protein
MGSFRPRPRENAARVTSTDCQFHRGLPLEAVIARLEARGVGGAHIGIVELAGLVRTP